MRFMMMVKHSEKLCGPPPKAFMEAMVKISEEAIKNGSMVLSGGLAPPAASTRVRLSQGQITPMDGPFTEAKEIVGGFAVLEFKSKEEAIQSAINFMGLHKTHWPGWEGETEVRQLLGPEDFAPQP